MEEDGGGWRIEDRGWMDGWRRMEEDEGSRMDDGGGWRRMEEDGDRG